MRKMLIILLLAGCSGPQPSSGLTSQTLNVADAALSSGNPELALQISHSVLERSPKNTDAKLHEADALYALGRNNAAQAIYQQVYNIGSTEAAAAGLAKCLLRENPQYAISLLKGAIQKSPDDTSLLTNLGVAEDLAGDHHAAKLTYQHVLDLDPTQVAAQADLALSLALSGNPNQASEILKPLATAPNSTARLRQDYGAVLALAGHTYQGAAILAADLPEVQAYNAAKDYKSFLNLNTTSQ